jgi:hypothetical protein
MKVNQLKNQLINEMILQRAKEAKELHSQLSITLSKATGISLH